VVSHLGHLLKAGDLVMGYDLSRAVFADVDPDMKLELFPDVVLVKKVFHRDASRKRAWKLKKLATNGGEEGRAGGGTSAHDDAEAQQYEEFLQDVERDKKLRANIAVYKGACHGLSCVCVRMCVRVCAKECSISS
jgi:nonsense-mediated mRNA decay protein 3